MSREKTDRRIQRTRASLSSALRSLISERGYEDLTVRDILERADVGRSTFYSHYDSKDDLLLSSLGELQAGLAERQRQAHSRAPSGRRPFAFLEELFEHVDEHRDLFHAMVGKQSGAVVESFFRKMMVDLVREDVRARGRRAGGDDLPVEALAQFVGGGFFGLLIWWTGSRDVPSPGRISHILRALGTAALVAAVPPETGPRPRRGT